MTRRAIALLAVLSTSGCATEPDATTTAPANPLPPEPTVTHSGEGIEHGELILDVDEIRKNLHAQHHPHGVLETRRVPGEFTPPAMTEISDFALKKEDLVVINPGPGEYVHVMEGRRHGYLNLTIGITYTAPGGAPPLRGFYRVPGAV